MDKHILKMILFSCESTAKDLETSEELLNILNYEYFPLPERIVNALSISFTNLLCYRVSQQMHQRHAIQMQVVESLRCCSKIEDVFGVLDTHVKKINVTSVAIKILMEKLTPQRLKESSLKTLMYLFDLTRCLLSSNHELRTFVNYIIISIAKHPSVTESEEFLENTLIQSQTFLDKKTIEIIYTYHIKHLIEKPIIDDFCEYIINTSKSEFKCKSSEKLLLTNIVDFPLVFQRASVILKEIFIRKKYAAIVRNFTTLFLSEIIKKCNAIQFLDLYPLKLQPCVCLMKIEPHLHSQKSKDQLFEFVKEISINNNSDLIILLMHFPSWLEELAGVVSVPIRGISLFAEFIQV